MKNKSTKVARSLVLALAAAALSLSLVVPAQLAAQETVKATQPAVVLSPKEKELVAAFEGRVKAYADMREAVEDKMTPLPKDATPEQIDRHKAAFMAAVRDARASAKFGDIFTPESAAFIRATIRDEFRGQDRREYVKAVMEAETKGVPMRVNYPYPDDKEQLEVPPTLLLRLPQLPKQVKYRFVGRNLLLVDRENTLIVDLMTDALPDAGVAPTQVASEAAETTETAEGTPVAARTFAPYVSLTLPSKKDSLRFAVIGDTGTGTEKQHELADVMHNYHAAFPFEFVLLLGDNMYGGEKAEDFKVKFENVYKPLLNDKVKFYAALGNHDESNQRFYELFNMNGEEYYRFEKGGVAFYALNSNYMDKRQLKWLEDQLAKDTSRWKIAFFHHPPYSSGGKHGSSTGLREVVEPVFVKYGVNVVLAGHEHFYERVKPQKGVYYFISGAGGKLRKGDVKDDSGLTEKAYDEDMSFMLFEAAGDELHFQVVSRTGQTVDSGLIPNAKAKPASK
ncbi:MAG TPA: metallophosphoesterase [Pyrinomonadaceae bacterium]|nr:metallophosphoesterase [Pyrinomonadaceae bacterium]